jgi:hypothetical protein
VVHAAGKFGFWRFDKRTYVKPPPRRLGDPPEKMQNDMVRALISHINEATGEAVVVMGVQLRFM